MREGWVYVIRSLDNVCYEYCHKDAASRVINEAKEVFEKQISQLKFFLKYRGKYDRWQKELDSSEAILNAGFEVVTDEEYNSRAPDVYISERRICDMIDEWLCAR